MTPRSLITSLAWPRLASPLAGAEDALARLDERLRDSPLREGWIARTDFADACASLWRDGELVPLEDLVLREAGMDARAPAAAVVEAGRVLLARRRIAAAAPDWALSPEALEVLRGRLAPPPSPPAGSASDDPPDEPASDDFAAPGLAAAMAGVDAALARVRPAPPPRDPVLYDEDWDEAGRLAEWREALDLSAELPPALAAAFVMEVWERLAPLQHQPWLGRLLAAAVLRARGKTRAHLPGLSVGWRVAPRRPRGRDFQARVEDHLATMAAAAGQGLGDHARWLAARALLTRRCAGRRSTSRLPALVEFVLSRPLVSAATTARALGVSPQAALGLIAALDLRETTGRGRYRAWGVL